MTVKPFQNCIAHEPKFKIKSRSCLKIAILRLFLYVK